jgi:transcriptional regulator with XRE-family HTH domain
VIIGDRLRAMREDKHFSQGDIEKKTGLLRVEATNSFVRGLMAIALW